MTRRKVVTASLVAGAIAIVAQSVAHLIATVEFGVCDASGFGPCSSVFDLDHNNGISDVVSSFVIAVAGIGAAVLGTRRRPREVMAFVLAAFLFLISFDDTLHLEDTVRNAYGVFVFGTIVTAGVLLVRVAASVSSETRRLMLFGVAILALDIKFPFVYDQMMNVVGQPNLVRGDLLYELGVVLDEAMELAGWTLLAVGLWDAALSIRPADAVLPDRARPGVGMTR